MLQNRNHENSKIQTKLKTPAKSQSTINISINTPCAQRGEARRVATRWGETRRGPEAETGVDETGSGWGEPVERGGTPVNRYKISSAIFPANFPRRS